MNSTKENVFLQSALTLDNSFLSMANLQDWLDEKRQETYSLITPIPFSDMDKWEFDPINGNLVHQSGKFFSIEGITVKTNWGSVAEWSQPIINQAEIGFLGILTKKFDGVLYFLMQAKIEPGNINIVQLSPTLQATKSNYLKVHKGSAPHYLDYFFKKRKDVVVLLDQLQSEQGARFLKKRNRNIIIEVFGDIEVKESFCWVTLGQIKKLLMSDNLVNMDTRTVISGIPYGDKRLLEKSGKKVGDSILCNIDGKLWDNSSFENDLLRSELGFGDALYSIDDIISWITRHKAFAELDVTGTDLNKLVEWERDETSIFHKELKYFSVIAVRVEIGNREVSCWTQPIIKSSQEGMIAFIIKKINGVYHFLVQAKLESGNFDIIELAPTIQCLTGNYRKGRNEYEVKFLDYALEPEKKGCIIHYSAFQSEEGGRFYREQNKNMIIEAGDDFCVQVPDEFIWMTMNQMKTFIKFNNYFNIQSRSLLSVLNFM